MGIIFIFLGVIILFCIFAIWLASYFEKHNKIIFTTLCISLSIIFFTIPFYKDSPIEIKHHIIKTDIYNDIKFENVKQIEYDTYSYNWWTMNYINNTNSKYNEIVKDLP